MTINMKPWTWQVVTISLIVLVGVVVGISNHFANHPAPSPSAQLAHDSFRVPVSVLHPRHGAMEHVTIQPGTVQAIESVQLFAKASGYLKTQNVDIGDRVTQGQVLIVVDVPEIDKQVLRNTAGVALAQAKVEQMRTRILSAKADAEAARIQIVQAETNAKSAAAVLRFRSKQLQRMQELFDLKSIDERLVDENRERKDAAVESENSAKASINTAHALLAASVAKIEQTKADLVESEAEVEVSKAELEKSKVLLDYATLKAPFDGIITHRAKFPGDFVRSATEGGNTMPLLTMEKTDRMRVIVQVPDRDAPYVDVGDAATIEIDARPGEKLHAKVSRIAGSEDPDTRLMRVEIDLPNPTGKIRQGMYGRVSILLEEAHDVLSVPSSCLVGKAGAGKGTLFVVREGSARLITVRLGTDNGIRVEVLQGVSATDQVIAQPGGTLADGVAVQATLRDDGPSSGHK